MKKKISITIEEKTLKDVDSMVDNIYVRNRSQAIELLVNAALGEQRHAVLLAGGPDASLRMDGGTYRFEAIIGKYTLLEHQLAKLKSEGFTNIFFIGRKGSINAAFSLVQNGTRLGVKVDYIEEQDGMGTADTLRYARGKIDANFLVVYADVFFDQLSLDELWTEHLRHKGLATLLLTTTPDPSKKGVVKIEGSRVKEFIQKPQESEVYLGFSSLFISQPGLLEYGGKSLEKEVFPLLAQRNLLFGFVSTTSITKLRAQTDAAKCIMK